MNVALVTQNYFPMKMNLKFSFKLSYFKRQIIREGIILSNSENQI